MPCRVTFESATIFSMGKQTAYLLGCRKTSALISLRPFKKLEKSYFIDEKKSMTDIKTDAARHILWSETLNKGYIAR